MSRSFLYEHPAVRWAGRILLSAAAVALLLGAENTKKPISRDRLFKAVEIGGLTNDEFVAIIKDFGVEFELNSDDRQNLAKAGVEEPVMAAIASNFRDPIREKISQLTQGGPLAKDNIIGLLKAGAGSDIVEALVDKRGISFAMAPGEAKEIEGAGGSKGLIGALLLKEPVKVASAAVPAPPDAKEPVLVAASTAAATIVPQAQPVPPPASLATATAATAANLSAKNVSAQRGPQSAAPAPVTATQPTTQAAVQPGTPAATSPAPATTPSQPISQAIALLTSSAKPAKLIKGGVQYSEIARRVHAVGKVTMEIVINEQGRIEQLKGISGNPLLVQSATQSMKDWLYEPATIDGRPTKVSTQVSVDFQ